MQHFLMNNKPPEKLNILIRPLLASLNHEKYNIFVEKTSLSLFNLTILFESKSSSPIPKVIKNVLSSLQESNKNESHRKIKDNNINFLYSVKAQGVNTFLSQIIEKYNDQIFVKYPSILQTIMNEIETFEKIFDEGKNIDSIIKIVNFENIRQNLKILKSILPSSFLNPKIFSNLDEIFNKLLKLIHFFNLMEKNNNLHLDIIEHENNTILDRTQTQNIIYNKIYYILIKMFKNFLLKLSEIIINERKNERYNSLYCEFFILFMEKLYLLLKDGNILIYELLSSNKYFFIDILLDFLDIYCDYEENFVELAPVFIIQILKSLNNKNRRVRELSFRCLGEMINSSLVQVNFLLRYIYLFMF